MKLISESDPVHGDVWRVYRNWRGRTATVRARSVDDGRKLSRRKTARMAARTTSFRGARATSRALRKQMR
jgi:hypothetical protein